METRWAGNIKLSKGFISKTPRLSGHFTLSYSNNFTSPGKEWQPDSLPVHYSYLTNTEPIPSWRYIGDVYDSINYEAGTLYVNLITDEDKKYTRTYTDFQGKVVMKETKKSDNNWIRTLYCFDDFGLLRCVLQPQASTPSDIEGCFFYKYDSRHRMTHKKVPGSNWVFLIYDSKDRLVVTSDGNSRVIDKWFYTAYDNFNRPIRKSYFITNTSGPNLAVYYTTNNTPYSEESIMEKIDYDVIPSVAPYTNPVFTFTANDLVSLNDKATNTKGLLVAKTVKAIMDNITLDYDLGTVNYYDKYGRVIQSISANRFDYDRITNKYNFSGEIIQTREEHNFNSTVRYTIDIYYKYDHRGRLLKTDYQVKRNSVIEIPKTIVSANVYNEAGFLKTKYLHSVASTDQAFIQKTDYKYNIRGWLTGINDPGLTSGEGDKFGMKLGYNKQPDGTTIGLYNGNISGIKWGTENNKNLQYLFTYDGLDRLKTGTFSGPGFGALAYNTSYQYNKNGNPSFLTRYEATGVCSDAMGYTYDEVSKRLSATNDSEGDLAGVEDFEGTLTGLGHYVYDFNGNLTRDDYKSVTISYNCFNNPLELDFGSNKKEVYIYDGSGEKLYRKITDGSNPSVYTDYIGMIVRGNVGSGNSSLKYIITPEGRIVNSGSDTSPVWSWEYNLKDHLGNVRTVITPGTLGGSSTVLQQTHYYPYGMRMSQISNTAGTGNDYLFGGKQYQEDFGLNWYDFGARFYDPCGRLGFTTIDPSASDYFAYSPYLYVGNNPIRRIDPDGRDPWDVVIGFSAAVIDNACGGITNIREVAANYVTDADDFNLGLTSGDITSVAIGRAEASGGAGMVEGGYVTAGVGVFGLVFGGTGAVVIAGGEATAASGVLMVTHGGVMMASGTRNLAQGKGQLPENKPNTTNSKPASQTSSGKATDQHGNKIGPSGKPQVNTVQHSSQKGAKDAARNEGKGAPVKHTNPEKGRSHYHSTNKNREKKANSTHHEY